MFVSLLLQLFQLTKDCVENKVSCQAVNEFKGGYTHKLLSRSRLFERPGHDGRLLAVAGEEATKTVRSRLCSIIMCAVYVHTSLYE